MVVRGVRSGVGCEVVDGKIGDERERVVLRRRRVVLRGMRSVVGMGWC